MTATGPTRPPWSDATPADDGPATGVPEAELVVVGAGLAGLSTAWHVLERMPAGRVLVLEAGARVAAGASGRGTGLLGPRVGPPMDLARRRYGDVVARRMYEASEAAVRQVLDLVDRLDIHCGLAIDGQLVAARSPRTGDDLLAQSRAYADLGLDVPLLDADETRERAGPAYRTALWYGTAATLDPEALTRGLAAAARQRGGRLHTDSPVLDVTATRQGITLVLPACRVRARSVVFATNAYTSGLGLPVGTLLPLVAHAVATEPLGADALAALGGTGAPAVIGAGTLSPYHRIDGDGRLVMGGGRVLYPRAPGSRRDAELSRRTWSRLARHVHGLHPALAETAVTHRWSGPIAMTADHLPVVGAIPGYPGCWFAGGWSGHGLAMSVAAGEVLAAAIVDGEAPDPCLPWHRGAAPSIPVRGATGVLARPALRAYLATLAYRAGS